jgi:DNA-binding IclR family transcriptional regulator
MTHELKTAHKIFEVIDVIQKLNTPTLTEAAVELDTPKSTVLNYLRTLEDLGYVIEEDGQYRLSLQFLDHGMHTKRQLKIARHTPDVLKQLASDTDEAAWVMTEERGYVIGIGKELGPRAVQTTGRIGRHTRFHYHAPGKAMLSAMPEPRAREIVEGHGMPAKTSETITDLDALMEQISEFRETGVAFDVGEAIEGLRSVAAPVTSGDGVEGAIAVVGPENRLKGDRFREEIPDMVAGAANEIELRLRYEDA